MVVLTHDVDPQGDLVVLLGSPNSTGLIPKVYIKKCWSGISYFILGLDTFNLPKVKSILQAVDAPGLVHEVRFRVSSHHMKMASPVFAKMLDGPWSESNSLNSSPTPASLGISSAVRPREVTARGWDADALLVVLNVIHGINDQVPREVSVDFLVEIAGVVDYYHCQRVMQLAGEVWRQKVYEFPAKYGKGCISWLSISWAFGWEDVSSQLGSFIIAHGQGLSHIKSDELPVTPILGKLDKKRQEYIAKIITRLDEVAEDLLNGRVGCSNECSSMLLGSLLRKRHASALLNSTHPSPYTNYSVNDFIKEALVVCTIELGSIKRKRSATPHTCSIAAMMKPFLKEIWEEIRRFKISDLQDK